MKPKINAAWIPVDLYHDLSSDLSFFSGMGICNLSHKTWALYCFSLSQNAYGVLFLQYYQELNYLWYFCPSVKFGWHWPVGSKVIRWDI